MLGAELSPDGIGYFWLQSRRDFDADLYDFFGHTNYVEISDQSFGRYGGLESITIVDDGAAIEMQFTFDLPTGGRALKVVCLSPLDTEIVAWLEVLACDVAAERSGNEP